MDENLIEAILNKNTRAIVQMHYSGVGCERNNFLKNTTTILKLAANDYKTHLLEVVWK